MNLENISKINNKKKTLSKIDFFSSVIIIINLIVTSIALIIDKTPYFPEIEAQPLFNIDSFIVVVVLPVTVIIKKIINHQIKKLKNTIINFK